MKCTGKFGQVMAGENTQVFLTWNLKNKLLKKCVLWMIDSRIHKNMKISRGGSVPKTRLLWLSTQYIITVMTGDRRDELRSQFLLHSDLYKFLTIMPVWFIFFSSFLFSSVFFLGHETTYIIRVFAVYKLHYYIYWNDSLTECTKPSKLGKSI